MRNDVAGFFWDDTPPPKPPPKTPEKRTPPERTWESPDYLPHLDEALNFVPDLFTQETLSVAAFNRDVLIFDIECYPNYFLAAFQSTISHKIIYFESSNKVALNVALFKFVLTTFPIIGFNLKGYDIPVASLAIAGKSTEQLMAATMDIIVNRKRPRDLLREAKVRAIKCQHIDLLEVPPQRTSLKVLAGRMHSPRMVDLPFVPGTYLTDDQITILRWYCFNDLYNTELLYLTLKQQLKLRETMSVIYNQDLKSKSDAQIAEAIIVSELRRINGYDVKHPDIFPGSFFHYKPPTFLNFKTETMRYVFDVVKQSPFIISEAGEVIAPAAIKELEIPIGNGVYRMGIGGLHSSEKQQHWIASDDLLLMDRDVTSYYPFIILKQGLYPEHLGTNFLVVYEGLVNRRIEAKRNNDHITADSLKITINGSFGKLGSPYSYLYSPNLLIQVTLTGQLALLMLIERLEMTGFTVASANTDGIVIACPTLKRGEAYAIIKQWETEAGLETEETLYRSLWSRDVNNYIAFKQDGSVKTKGAFSLSESLAKNPTGTIAMEAVIEYLKHGTPISQTIRACPDIRKFCIVRKVTGGAVKNGAYIGVAIRWYYSNEEQGDLIYAATGNKVPRSENAKPIMVFPETFPHDVLYEWYEAESLSILNSVGINLNE